MGLWIVLQTNHSYVCNKEIMIAYFVEGNSAGLYYVASFLWLKSWSGLPCRDIILMRFNFKDESILTFLLSTFERQFKGEWPTFLVHDFDDYNFQAPRNYISQDIITRKQSLVNYFQIFWNFYSHGNCFTTSLSNINHFFHDS